MSESSVGSGESKNTYVLMRAFEIVRDRMVLAPENFEMSKRLSRTMLKLSKATGDISPESLAEAAIYQMISNSAPR